VSAKPRTCASDDRNQHAMNEAISERQATHMRFGPPGAHLNEEKWFRLPDDEVELVV
jgi:hypothetical protein